MAPVLGRALQALHTSTECVFEVSPKTFVLALFGFVALGAFVGAAVVLLLIRFSKGKERPPLQWSEMPSDPYVLLNKWIGEATAGMGELCARSMVLATSDPDEGPTARTVALQDCDSEYGYLSFHTSSTSLKARQLAADPRCEMVLTWGDRQVRIRGEAYLAGPGEESDAAFQKLSAGEQASLHVLRQGEQIGEKEFEGAAEQVRQMVSSRADAYDTAESFSSVTVQPWCFEFYQGHVSTWELGTVQHDRFLYVRDAEAVDCTGQSFLLTTRLQP